MRDDALSICNNNIESCVVDLKFNKVSITIVAVYRPPQGSKQDFTLELDHILSNIKNRNSRVTILGDMNINLYDVNDTSTVDYTSTLYSRSMMPLISKPTRFPNAGHASNPSILDHIWTNCLNVANCGVVDFDVTDHLPTFCFLDLPSGELNDEKIKIESRPFSEQNLVKLIAELEKVDWDNFLNYEDPDNCTNRFVEKVNHLYMKCFPLKIKFISIKRYINRWITNDVKKLIDKKI